MYKKFRFGLIVPSSNVVIEPEFYSIALENIGFYSSRVLHNECTPNQLKKMGEFSQRAALELSTINASTILYAATSGSLIGGVDGEKDLRSRISKISGVPTITAAGSVRDALIFMKISKVNMFTPYIDEINMREKEFLEKSGIKVLSFRGLGIVNSAEMAEVEPKFTIKKAFMLHQKNKEAQAMFLSCTNLRTFDIIDDLERKIGVPVITSNQVSLWNLLKSVKLQKTIKGLGKLFAKHK